MESLIERQWPLFGLRLCTPRLELRLPRDDDLAVLADLAAAGIHPPEAMPFAVPWTRVKPPWLQREVLRYHWEQRAQWRPESWTAAFVVIRGGVVVGSQGLSARDFTVMRSVKTGSWVGQAYQGQGIGTEMRAAVLHLAFAGLGALEARSNAFADNLASAAVSSKLGYEADGIEFKAPEGERRESRRFRLTRERWEACSRIPVVIEGLDPCLPLFGA